MRLIDADELMEHVWRDKLDSRELIAEMIDNAPTIKTWNWINDIKITVIEDKLEELFERVENIEKQIKEEKLEELKKLKAELDYAKFRCALPSITDMMLHN